MQIKIKNAKEVSNFLELHTTYRDNIVAVKGDPPKGATYGTGAPIQSVSVRWVNANTGDSIDIEWEEVSQDD